MSIPIKYPSVNLVTPHVDTSVKQTENKQQATFVKEVIKADETEIEKASIVDLPEKA